MANPAENSTRKRPIIKRYNILPVNLSKNLFFTFNNLLKFVLTQPLTRAFEALAYHICIFALGIFT
jgi:hypothetical protein